MIAQTLRRAHGWLRSLFRRNAVVELEMANEMTAHLEQATERLMARGMSPTEARVQARREFGNVGVFQENARDARGVRPVTDLWDDLRYSVRTLRRTPVFTVAAILTLVLGIGSVAATFAIVYGVLLEPLPYGHPDRLVSVGLTCDRPSSDAYNSRPPSTSPTSASRGASTTSASIERERQYLDRRRWRRTRTRHRDVGDRVDDSTASGHAAPRSLVHE